MIFSHMFNNTIYGNIRHLITQCLIEVFLDQLGADQPDILDGLGAAFGQVHGH